MYKPYLRAALESDLKKICEGKLNANDVYESTKNEIEDIFINVFNNTENMKNFLKNNYLNSNRIKNIFGENHKDNIDELNESLKINCQKCFNKLQFKKRKKDYKFFISCSTFPTCNYLIDLKSPLRLQLSLNKCSNCNNYLYSGYDSKDKLVYDNKCLNQCLIAETLNDNKKVIPNVQDKKRDVPLNKTKNILRRESKLKNNNSNNFLI